VQIKRLEGSEKQGEARDMHLKDHLFVTMVNKIVVSEKLRAVHGNEECNW